ncbi:MAG: UPF0149 family protein [Burkholderiales bacterium]|nr:UPF0149 family protein [Burkholderiales bacterium]
MSEADFDELGDLLAADWAPESAMDLEQLDGFLAGVICAPRALLPSAWLPAVFGGEPPEFPDADTAQRVFELLMRRHNEIADALNAPVERLDDPRAYDPLLIDWDRNAEGVRQLAESGEVPRLPLYGELWAHGFLRAVDLARDDWDELPDDDEEGAQLVDESLAAIVALVPEDDDEARQADEAGEDRDELVADALIAAYDLRDYWRELQFEQVRVKEPIRRQPKIGRNDPCPCGSGRKFKQCHGREQ